jgi:hypothetical protein
MFVGKWIETGIEMANARAINSGAVEAVLMEAERQFSN